MWLPLHESELAACDVSLWLETVVGELCHPLFDEGALRDEQNDALNTVVLARM